MSDQAGVELGRRNRRAVVIVAVVFLALCAASATVHAIATHGQPKRTSDLTLLRAFCPLPYQSVGNDGTVKCMNPVALVYTYSNEGTDTAAHRAAGYQAYLQHGSWVVGRDWTVSCYSPAECTQIRGTLGGTVQSY